MMPRQKTKHCTFHYAVAGRHSDPPLLVLHGFLGSSEDFAMVLPTLSTRFYCIVPDLPGHGQTTTQAESGYEFEAIAQSLIHLLDALGISQSALLGYSMGGRLALYLVCHFPERFTYGVLESASAGLKTAQERQARIEKDRAIARDLQTRPFTDFLAQLYRNPLFASLQNHPEAYAAMLARRQQNQPAALAKVLQGCSTGRMRSLWDALPDIKVPLLLLVGQLDDKFVALNQEMLATRERSPLTRVKAIDLKVIENCGHNLHLEAPDRYVCKIIQWCSV